MLDLLREHWSYAGTTVHLTKQNSDAADDEDGAAPHIVTWTRDALVQWTDVTMSGLTPLCSEESVEEVQMQVPMYNRYGGEVPVHLCFDGSATALKTSSEFRKYVGAHTQFLASVAKGSKPSLADIVEQTFKKVKSTGYMPMSQVEEVREWIEETGL